jgi:hypothetical protein
MEGRTRRSEDHGRDAGGQKGKKITVPPDARLDDLSSYEKIAFYKLVSRKELEGIADRVGHR